MYSLPGRTYATNLSGSRTESLFRWVVCKLVYNKIPICIAASPFLAYFLCGKVQHFHETLIIWKYKFSFSYFPELTIKTLYDICSIHNLTDIIRKYEESCKVSPVVFPTFLAFGYLLSHFSVASMRFSSAASSFTAP